MALEDKLKRDAPSMDEDMQEEDDREYITDEEEKDLRIMVNLAKNLIDEGGNQVIEQAMNSSDPGQVIGQFLFQLGDEIAEQLPDDVKPSPRIMLIEGGWVEQVSDYLQEEYDVPSDIMDRAEMYIGSAAQQVAQGEDAQQQQAQTAAPMPQQPQPGVMPNG